MLISYPRDTGSDKLAPARSGEQMQGCRQTVSSGKTAVTVASLHSRLH